MLYGFIAIPFFGSLKDSSMNFVSLQNAVEIQLIQH